MTTDATVVPNDDNEMGNEPTGYDFKARLRDVVNHQVAGDSAKADEVFKEVIAQKTAGLLSQWYNVSTDLKTSLAPKAQPETK